MNTGTTILALLILGGGVAYGTHRVLNDPDIIPGRYNKPDRWSNLRLQAKGRRYVVYLEAQGPKGFSPFIPTTGVYTNDLVEAQSALASTAERYIEEATDVLEGRKDPNVLRGITSQQIGIFDIVGNRIIDKYDIKTPSPRRRG